MGQKISGNDRSDFLKSYKEKSLAALEKIAENEVAQLIELLSAAREAGRQIFLCGNGGSAATASHFANDLGKGASWGQEKRFRDE